MKAPPLQDMARRSRLRWWLVASCVLGAVLFCYTQLTLFVVQPIGAVPDGRILVLWRRSVKLNFIDSADAFCQRESGGVSLLCRVTALGGVMHNNPIIFRLPYVEALYLISTNGARYDR